MKVSSGSFYNQFNFKTPNNQSLGMSVTKLSGILITNRYKPNKMR